MHNELEIVNLILAAYDKEQKESPDAQSATFDVMLSLRNAQTAMKATMGYVFGHMDLLKAFLAPPNAK